MLRFSADPDAIDRHLHALCRDIGNRLAATDAERRAAEYVAGQMREIGLQNVTVEPFSFRLWGYETAYVTAVSGDERTIEAIPVANSPATPEGGVEAELIYVDNATPADLAMHDVEGRIALVWGLFGDTPDTLRALDESGAAGVLWVDDRLPFDWPVSVGTPYDWRDILDAPQLCISYQDGLELAKQQPLRVRMVSDAWSEPGESLNVFGDLPGEGEEMVHIGAHIDSVIVGTGAEDDASGIAAMLEAGRLLAGLDETPQRTIRLCGFGAEEQLSEGARRYVASHAQEVERTRLMIQLDSVAALTGRNQLRVVGPPELADMTRALMAVGYPHHREARSEAGAAEDEEGGSIVRGGDIHHPEEAGPGSTHGPSAGTPSTDRGSMGRAGEFYRPREIRPSAGALPVISGEVLEELSPYSDMFPFNVRGVPSVWLHRMNQAGTRWFHHSRHDDLPQVSADVIATHANATADLAHRSAFVEPPFARAIPAEQMAQIEEMAEQFLG